MARKKRNMKKPNKSGAYVDMVMSMFSGLKFEDFLENKAVYLLTFHFHM